MAPFYRAAAEDRLSIYGVGPATAWYLLFDIFHRYDFFDHISPWEQKIYSKILLGRPPSSPAPIPALLKRINRYGPFRQLAVHYLWEDLWWAYHRGEAPWLAELINRHNKNVEIEQRIHIFVAHRFVIETTTPLFAVFSTRCHALTPLA